MFYSSWYIIAIFPLVYFIFLLLLNDFLLVDLCFFVFVFMYLDSSLNDQESILTCFLSFDLIIKLYHYHYGSVTLYYSFILLNCIKVDCFILLCRYYLFSIAFIILFLF